MLLRRAGEYRKPLLLVQYRSGGVPQGAGCVDLQERLIPIRPTAAASGAGAGQAAGTDRRSATDTR